jgi:hypothetical protein
MTRWVVPTWYLSQLSQHCTVVCVHRQVLGCWRSNPCSSWMYNMSMTYASNILWHSRLVVPQSTRTPCGKTLLFISSMYWKTYIMVFRSVAQRVPFMVRPFASLGMMADGRKTVRTYAKCGLDSIKHKTT